MKRRQRKPEVEAPKKEDKPIDVLVGRDGSVAVRPRAPEGKTEGKTEGKVQQAKSEEPKGTAKTEGSKLGSGGGGGGGGGGDVVAVC